MIRATNEQDIEALVQLTAATGTFKPLEIQALREVLDDYFAENQALGHCAVTSERDGQIMGFAYYAPAAMTEGTWQLWWIVVRKDVQAQGLGAEMLQFVEDDVRRRQGRVLFIETSSLPHYERTRQFYLRHEYEQHAVLNDFYAAGDSMVIFRKALQGL